MRCPQKAWTLALALAMALSAPNQTGAAELLPLSAFATPPAIADVAISPSGHYLAVGRRYKGRMIVFVLDRSNPSLPPRPVSTDTDNGFHIAWCRWATDTRLVCGYRAMQNLAGTIIAVTRLAAVDADGGHLMPLLKDSVADVGQFQDGILDWSAGTPGHVLVQADEDLLDFKARQGGAQVVGRTTSGGYPAVFDLDVVSGRLTVRQHSREPMRSYVTDHHGHLRLAYACCGPGKTISLYSRLSEDDNWRKLLQYEAFSRSTLLHPIAIDAQNPEHAYALGPSDGRTALWSVDLTDKEPPKLVFDHPLVDIEGPLFAKNGSLIGVEYETDLPHVYYTEPLFDSVVSSVRKTLGNVVVSIVDVTEDRSTYVLRASSDIDAGTYYLLSRSAGSFEKIGTSYPELPSDKLGRLTTISYPARDGTEIPGYLMTPPGIRAEHVPLIVMPHGGPIARDSWRFDFLQQFLVSRGYAVLQMNFRGSAGYGDGWFYAAHQDWGGLTYSDIEDGAKWAIAEGIADPAHVCIVGWSFGGYAALLGAVRASGLFRCAVSIAGVSDLSLLLYERQSFMGYGIAREQIGTNSQKLAADSPRRHAGEVKIPVLMIHGDRDAQVAVEQSRAMASALSEAGKTFEFQLIPGADHQMSRESDRTTMLTAIETFLRKNLGPGAAATP